MVFPWGLPTGVRQHLLWKRDDGEKEEKQDRVMKDVGFTCHSVVLMSLFMSKNLNPHLEHIQRRQGPQENLPVCRNFFGMSTFSQNAK